MVSSSSRARGRAGVTSRGLLLLGSVILAATVGVLAVAVIMHLRRAHTPVLPVSWVRAAGDELLPPLTWARWFTSWQFDAVATAALAGVAAIYLAGVVAVGRRRRRRWPLWRTLCFLAGLGVCLLAVSSAIGVYDMALFSVHMVGHLALVMVAPPLLVAGRPLVLALHAVGNPWHSRFKRMLRSRVVSLWFSWPVALSTYAIVIVGTHLTGLMNVIMQRPWAGQVEHLAYVLVGYQFFTVAFGDEPLRWRLTPISKEMLLALAMGVDTITGVVLFQSTQPLVMRGVAGGGVDPLRQTVVGGAIMWAGGDGIMIAVMLILALSWLRRSEMAGRMMARGWLEQARIATLTAHAVRSPGGTSEPAAPATVRRVALDEDDRALADYNAWLQGLAVHRSSD
ncbi:MAG TPA: cytochrome c oxidase assembly protein [Blastococcus sp.]|jgi:putative copper resistance protein D|nr:cytochrome c oxidase assembly protein [Blastococcus sp.]